jgi:hypothetical protein
MVRQRTELISLSGISCPSRTLLVLGASKSGARNPRSINSFWPYAENA